MRRAESESSHKGGESRPWHFPSALEREVARARRFGSAVSLIVVGVDGPGGAPLDTARRTAVANRVGEAICRQTRSTDIVGHERPDQIAVLLPDTPVGSAYLLAERLRGAAEAVRETRKSGGLVSVGVASLAGAEGSAEELLAEAERALAIARAKGGGCCVVARWAGRGGERTRE